MPNEPTPSSINTNESLKKPGKAANSAAGGCLGFIAGSMGFTMSLIVGGLLCLTGVGAIIGIPMILGGCILPFLGAGAGGAAGFAMQTESCPYCGHEIKYMKNNPGLDCPACAQRIIIRDGKPFQLPSKEGSATLQDDEP